MKKRYEKPSIMVREFNNESLMHGVSGIDKSPSDGEKGNGGDDDAAAKPSLFGHDGGVDKSSIWDK